MLLFQCIKCKWPAHPLCDRDIDDGEALRVRGHGVRDLVLDGRRRHGDAADTAAVFEGEEEAGAVRGPGKDDVVCDGQSDRGGGRGKAAEAEDGALLGVQQPLGAVPPPAFLARVHIGHPASLRLDPFPRTAAGGCASRSWRAGCAVGQLRHRRSSRRRGARLRAHAPDGQGAVRPC